MVRGFESFQSWFQGYEEQYAIIGGTACDILMAEENMDFRATKDIDLVLILEAMTPDFGTRFWNYIIEGQYQHCNKSTGEPEFYRFSQPKSNDFPAMIELFSRRSDAIQLPDDAVLTPLPIDEDIRYKMCRIAGTLDFIGFHGLMWRCIKIRKIACNQRFLVSFLSISSLKP
jgi:hypothetical protein